MDGLYRSSFYPSIHFFANPFKTLELRALFKPVAFNRHDMALDIGSGLGLQTSIIATRVGRVIGIDVSDNAVNRAKSEQYLMQGRGEVEFLCASIEEAGFADNSFDKIFSICVLEHIPDYQSVIRHCHRVLKPGGKMAFSIDSLATVNPEAVARHKERYAVCRYFQKEEIKKDFEAAGFNNVIVKPLAVSRLAARWFAEGIEREFIYRYSEAWFKFQILRVVEFFTPRRDKGIYLLVWASK